jgi:penicillin amidase
MSAYLNSLNQKPEKLLGNFYPLYFLNTLQQGDVACDALKMTRLEYATQVWEQTLTRLGKKIPVWGKLHQAVFNHSLLTHTPLAFLSDRKVPFGGDC